MGHAVVGREGDIVASLDFLARSEADGISLDNLLGKSLWRGGRGCLEGGEDGGGGGIFELGMEGCSVVPRR